jgi:hypothetical protein
MIHMRQIGTGSLRALLPLAFATLLHLPAEAGELHAEFHQVSSCLVQVETESFCLGDGITLSFWRPEYYSLLGSYSGPSCPISRNRIGDDPNFAPGPFLQAVYSKAGVFNLVAIAIVAVVLWKLIGHQIASD